MTDRRLIPANARVAKRGMASPPEGVMLTDGHTQRVTAEIADLCAAPDGARERQLLLGESVLTLETYDGWAFVQTASGYMGYVNAALLGADATVSHFVATAATHAYAEEGFKGSVNASLPFGAKVNVLDERKAFYETNFGFVPKSHLRPLDRPFSDPVTAAQLFFGVPYLWGGNSTRGIDCSGLISAAFEACGAIVPGDSDLQEQAFGKHLAGQEKPKRGDLMFWDGHVGIMVDEDVLLHANAHHMACRYENLEQAKARIEAQGDGVLTSHKRVG